ncbi:hypothetical protein A3A71_03910 [Candidatus Berkelbacteria bacterium RIFCSPLOWO2_01_FULL_50_28]|uniref:Uncharacterized protein n=1 Tax=Candidatus Berkelbacteria bacterium RIFCSPLOWO2_01_FULL_50_28 TaxID=1797471 RepID=A0A1F5EA72_9BACT|nr:MAG: hypothetical protein A3F39_01275 [Candidatus Berkelbacteria bacterium RIFCSPHIGHO2_12_FULL_50_11]OGD64288.1 MAG: hypothetical protein A3A71_03910 [Candidatus Berkelbacteria bacterium RIFCSPLOWO2_01_FULL_50_28]
MTEFFTSRFATIDNYFQTQHFWDTGWKNLFSWSFWSEGAPSPDSQYYLFTAILLVLSVGLLIFWRVRIKKAHKITPVFQLPLAQLANIIAFVIIIGITYYFFRSQGIVYLSSRLVVLLSLIVAALWLGWVAIYLKRVAPRKQSQYLEQERFFRYIPSKRKNK